MAVLSLLMVMVFSMVDSTQKTWNLARSRVSQYREARAAFEAVTTSLSQATLNPYWDYDYGGGKYKSASASNPTIPEKYQRQSELHFISGPSSELLTGEGADRRPGHSIFFQTAGGFGREESSAQLTDLLNSRGYYVQYGEDSAFKPSFLGSETTPRWRFRLMEFRPPTENLLVYLRALKTQGVAGVGASKTGLRSWFANQIGSEQDQYQVSRPIADNIIAAFFLPKLPENDPRSDAITLAPDYVYDSREWQHTNIVDEERRDLTKNLLPPLIEVTMVAVDEKSMVRYLQKNQKEVMPPFIPTGIFENFTNYDKFLDDLGVLKTSLESAGIEYRVFNQTIPMRGAGWSNSRDYRAGNQ